MSRLVEEVQVLGAGAGTLRTAWRYQPGKASQLAQVESTGRQPTSFVFNALGLLEKVRDGFGAGNTREFFYRANTQFLSRVRDAEIDGASGTTRVTEVAYDVNAFGQVTAIKVSVRRQREQAMDPTRAISKLARCAETT